MGALSSCGAWAVQHGGVSCCRARALVAWVLERGLRTGTWAQVLHSLWDLPWPGIEPGSPALVGGFLTTRPPGKPCMCPHTLEGTLRAWPSPQGSRAHGKWRKPGFTHCQDTGGVRWARKRMLCSFMTSSLCSTSHTVLTSSLPPCVK